MVAVGLGVRVARVACGVFGTLVTVKCDLFRGRSYPYMGRERSFLVRYVQNLSRTGTPCKSKACS